MQKDIDSGYAKDNKCDCGQSVHFSVQEPEEGEAETGPVPGNAEFFSARNGEFRKTLYVIVGIRPDKLAYFITADSVDIDGIERIEVDHGTAVAAFYRAILDSFLAVRADHLWGLLGEIVGSALNACQRNRFRIHPPAAYATK